MMGGTKMLCGFCPAHPSLLTHDYITLSLPGQPGRYIILYSKRDFIFRLLYLFAKDIRGKMEQHSESEDTTMKQYVDIILASGSPRRRELLSQAGLTFNVIVSNENEIIRSSIPAEVVKELAHQKAASVFNALEFHADKTTADGMAAAAGREAVSNESRKRIIIAADTIVVRDGTILGKPHDEADALQMLMSLAGRAHQVFTGICVLESEGNACLSETSEETKQPALLFAEETQVVFTSFSEAAAKAYIATGEPMDKAGSYGIQGLGSFLVKGITGDFHNVMGFPLGSFLRKGIDLHWFEI